MFPPRHDRMMRAGQYEVGDRAVILHNGHERIVTGVRFTVGANGLKDEAVQLEHHPFWHEADTVRPTARNIV
jgi:hypothetical protein